jgi:calcineurin-like phosphoesterase family protein
MKIDKEKFFAIGCLHANHKNICRGVSTWDNKNRTRDFKTLEEMNWAIINSINNKVNSGSVLFMLGDSFFGKKEETVPLLIENIVCKNIYYVYGNHCHFLRKSLDQYKHYFLDIRDRYFISCGRQQIVLNHYPYLVWEEMDTGSWSLCSHSHGNCKLTRPEDKTFKQLDVGWDVFNEPLSYFEIEKIMRTKGFASFDHHEKEKNEENS